MQNIENIFEFILNRVIDGRYVNPVIIGINGIDTSGKTEFTDRFGEFLSSDGVISRFLNPPEKVRSYRL